MLGQRARPDAALAAFRALASSGTVRFAASDALLSRIADAFASFDHLTGTDRGDVDAGRLGRAEASLVYTSSIDTIFHVYDSMAALDDPQITKDTRTLISLTRAPDLRSQGDARDAEAVASGALTAAEA